MSEPNYNRTIAVCCIGYVTQAIINNFAPLLFLIFHDSFGIPLERITALIALNFTVQLVIDLLAAKFADKIGYRRCVVAAHIFGAAGLVGLAVFPVIMPGPFIGLLVSVVLYAAGGGLIEVLVSPIIEATPSKNKHSLMSFLHSFYCWGTVGVIVISTVVLGVFGKDSWRVLACIWAVLPLVNAVFFTRVPIVTLSAEENRVPLSTLLKKSAFWMLIILMFMAGAAEMAMNQWASAFAESALGVSKTVGDLTGACMFSLLMGTARAIRAHVHTERDTRELMIWCGALCTVSYLMAAFAPHPAVALAGCGICGFSVGIMWPGIYSSASERLYGGSTALFAMLALAGDLGCAGGPTLVGLVAGSAGDDLSVGMLTAAIFPVLLVIVSIISLRTDSDKRIKEKNLK